MFSHDTIIHSKTLLYNYVGNIDLPKIPIITKIAFTIT